MKKKQPLTRDEIIFKSLVQAIPDIIYIIDKDGILTFVNDAIYKLGYQPEEIIGKHISMLLPKEDVEHIFRNHLLPSFHTKPHNCDEPPKLLNERRTGNRITRNLKLRLVPKDHKRKKSGMMDAEAVAVGLHDTASGNTEAAFLGTIGVIKDVTEVKKSEVTLTKTIRYYEMLIENISNVIIIAATDGTLLYTSPSIERVLGYGKAELIGENEWEYLHPDDRERIGRLFTDGNIKETAKNYMELRFLSKRGEWRLFELVIKPAFNENNVLVCLIFYLSDITRRRAAEEDLKKNEQRFRTLAENVKDIIFRYRLQPSRGFDYISPAAETVTGYRQEDFYNTPDLLMRMVSPEDRQLLESISNEKILFNRPYILRWIVADGRRICTEQSNVPVIDELGNVIAIEGIARDITERKKMEDNLKKSLREKEVLLTEIHHRVKNNMQIISSLLSLQSHNIRDDAVQDLFKDTQNRIHSIALIHNLMYKSKDLANVDFEEYIRSLAAVLLRTLSSNHEKISLTVDAKDVSLDINRAIPCGLIINEIVSNSIKHAFPGNRSGEISIGFSGNSGDRYTLRVRDNGIGVDPDIDPDGTGSIGLTIVRDLTEQLRGTFTMRNDNGTEIIISFPRIKPVID